jgi:hypothetical protein
LEFTRGAFVARRLKNLSENRLDRDVLLRVLGRTFGGIKREED